MFEKINLQLLADSVNHVNVTTDVRAEGQSYPDYNDLSAEMKTFYDMTLIDEASAQLVHDQFAQKRPIPKNGGKTIEFRKFTSLPKATSALTEGVTPVGKRLDVTTVTATVAQYGDYVTQSDLLEMTALDNTILEATKLLGKQAGLTLDTIVRNTIVAGTNVIFAPTVSGGVETAVEEREDMDLTSVLTVKMIQKAVAKLRAQNAPKIGGYYIGIIHPFNAYQLSRDSEWISASEYAGSTQIFEGEIGRIAGVRFVESSEAKIWNDSTCPAIVGGGYHSVYATLIFGEGAYATTEITGGGLQTFVKQLGSSGTADPLNQRSTVGWKASKVAEFLIPNYLVRIESLVPDFDDVAAN